MGFYTVEGHTCETENPRGFLAKRVPHRRFDRYLLGLTLVGLDQDHWIAIRRMQATPTKRRSTAVSGGGLAGVARS
jgi:hypothetical protein